MLGGFCLSGGFKAGVNGFKVMCFKTTLEPSTWNAPCVWAGQQQLSAGISVEQRVVVVVVVVGVILLGGH